MKRLILAVMMAGALAWFAGSRPAEAQTTANQPVLFGITFLQNQLITIDPTTGAGTLVKTINATESGYGLATYQEGLYTFNPNTNTIDRLSMVDAHVISSTSIGVTKLAGEGDLVISSTGAGYLASAFDSDGNPTHPLYKFDLTAATSSKLNNTSVALDGLALNPVSPNILYALGQGDSGDADPSTVDPELYTVDQTTGTLTPVGSIGVPQNSPIAGLTFSPDGTLYAAIDDKLYTIDTATGAAKLVDSDTPDFSFNSVSGLAFAPGASVLANLSSRADVLTGDNVLIQGFIIAPQDPDAPPAPTTIKEVILRGLGPSISLAGQPVAGILSDPTLTLYDSSGIALATNDNWKQNSTADQIEITDSGLAPSSDVESVIVAHLPQGSYTAILSGINGATGIALAEIYDLEEGNGLRAANMSARAFVSPGDNALISGMIVDGSIAKRVLIRGIGPSLTGEVSDPLDDPLLMAYDANGTLVETNDTWTDSPEVGDILSSGLAPTDAKEAVIDRIFAPGIYTVVLTGVGDATAATGIALVEAYDRD